MQKRISPEVRERAVRLVREHQQEYPSQTAAAAAAGKKLGLGRETVRSCVVQAEIDAGGRTGATSEELVEIKRLKAENRRLQEDVEILPAATTFFAGALDLWVPKTSSTVGTRLRQDHRGPAGMILPWVYVWCSCSLAVCWPGHGSRSGRSLGSRRRS